MKEKIKNAQISVIGAGSWGTSLANLLATKGFQVKLWCYESEVYNAILNKKENNIYLPGIRLSPNIKPLMDMEETVRKSNFILFVVPSHFMRETAEKVNSFAEKGSVFVSASKGIENDTFKTMTQIINEKIDYANPDTTGVISGPSFAKELGELKPTVVTVASSNLETAAYLQNIFAASFFRVYTSQDVLGVEIGGAVKNVIAIAAGVVDGMKLGLNARAAIITRGLVEIRRLGLAIGANPHTFSGLSGVGDLILTCTGNLSRNHTVGFKLGEGKKLDNILKEMRMVAEGIKSTKSVFYLAKKLEIELPICEEIYKVIYEGEKPERCVHRLMTRKLKHEIDFNIQA
ncbi:MAG: NAD(P)H-dependent glycerol-3-phosphate dehydrogenase [Deltaproteobacteria bacterium]|nr:MAG: NAD(P)H-dependent glycerol-3-phosphate dehydrogenase [Deltaproteobacteria bacterium]